MKLLRNIIALTLALSLLCTMTALGASSKTTKDEPYVVIDVENDMGTGPWIGLVDSDLADSEVQVISEISSITEFFASARDESGNTLDLTAMLNASEDQLIVHELNGVDAGGFTEGCGHVTAYFHFPTVYQLGGDVVVIIGIAQNPQAEAHEDKNIVWTGFPGEVVKSPKGRGEVIKVTFPEEMVLAIQNKQAIIVIVDQAN